jgi:hypothetical protein
LRSLSDPALSARRRRVAHSATTRRFEAGDADETRARFETAVRSLAQPMLSVPVPPTLTTAGWRVYSLEA